MTAFEDENNWISVDDELPPKDGLYEVTNDNTLIQQQGIMQYDGIGFFLASAYKPVQYWRYYISNIKKRYGKVK